VSDPLQPVLDKPLTNIPEEDARVEAALCLISNHNNIARFCARAAGGDVVSALAYVCSFLYILFIALAAVGVVVSALACVVLKDSTYSRLNISRSLSRIQY